jgi:Ca2+-transporting ATPase
MAFMGTMIASGKAKGVVVATGDFTELGKIGQMIQNAESQKTPLQVKMDQLGKHLSVLSFGSTLDIPTR